MAENYACQCNYEHNKERHRQCRKFRFVGENLALSSHHDVTRIIENWFSERQSYRYYHKACYPYGYVTTCEHYLQVPCINYKIALL